MSTDTPTTHPHRPTRHDAGHHPVPLRQRRRAARRPRASAGRRRRPGPRPRSRRRSRPRHRAPPHRQAVCRTPRTGSASTQEPRARQGRCRHRRRGRSRCGRLLARGRGLRRRPRLVRRVRRHHPRQALAQTRRHLLRSSRRRAHLGWHRPPSTHRGGLQAGQSVLVTGASGGVGSYAVQIADALGADVTGVCSPAKADYVRAIGAHHVLTYPHDDWTDGTRRWDLVLDIAGNPNVRQLRRALTPRGTAVFVGGENAGAILGMARQIRGALLSPFIGQRLVPLLARERADELRAAHPAHRSRPDGPGARPHLPARAGSRRHAATRTWCSSRQGRRRRVTTASPHLRGPSPRTLLPPFTGTPRTRAPPLTPSDSPQPGT